MSIMYRSTRSESTPITASQAILKGLSDDGGLFVPTELPKLDVSLEKLSGMTYREVAYEVMKLFLTDYTEEELEGCIAAAYDSKFDTPAIAPLRNVNGVEYMELFHGATIAFKDMALSILPHLMITAAKKNHEDKQIVILTATSGDTGKAALAGFADVPGTKIIVFYPKDGVSSIQERQMVTQKGENTCVVGIRGNFDDFDLWLATEHEPGDGDLRKLWQHSHIGKIAGIDKAVDINTFNGTRDEFRQWLDIPAPIPVSEPQGLTPASPPVRRDSTDTIFTQ